MVRGMAKELGVSSHAVFNDLMVLMILERSKSSKSRCPSIWTINRNCHVSSNVLCFARPKRSSTTIGDVQDSGWTPMSHPGTSQRRKPTKKRPWLLYGGQRLVRFAITFCNWAKPSQQGGDWVLWGNRRNIPKISPTAASTGQQKRSNPASQQRPSACFTNHHPKIKQIERRSSASPTITPSPDLSPTDCHLSKHFDNFLTGRTFANQDQAKTASSTFSNPEHSIILPTKLIDLCYAGESALIQMALISIKLNEYSLRYYSLK